MSRPAPSHARWIGLACILAILASACGGAIPAPQVQTPEGRRFIPLVPDSIDNVGLAPSVAVDAQGLPLISYFGFPAVLEEGEIPIARPVGSPFLTTEDGDDAGAVLLASVTPDQIWTRGAIAQPRETPGGVPVPFEPTAEPSLASLTPADAAGTDIAIAGTDSHAAWTTDVAVFYGFGPPFEIEPVEETEEAGAPSIVVDGAGTPIVAYTVGGPEPEVRVAERLDDGWTTTPALTLSRCSEGCSPPTQLALVGGEPLVVVTDPASGDVIAARRQGDAWTTEVVSTGSTGGASLATSGDTASIAFSTTSGVSLATGQFGSWSVEDVAPSAGADGDPAAPEGPTPPTTSVAIDSQGATWVAWQDPAGIHLASSGEGGFEEVELPDTSGGMHPSLAVTEDGSSIYLAWYDSTEGDLRLGTYGEIEDLLIAAPPPLPSVAPPSLATCGEDEEVVLDIVAQGSTFQPNCLVAQADEPFAINYDNQDAIIHNLVIAADADSVADPIFQSPDVPGPDQVTLDVSPLDAGEFFFVCTYHPSSMTGALAVITGGGGGDGGGGGGGG